MAWIYKQKGSDNWWIGCRSNGKQILKSTRTADRAEAERELERLNSLVSASRGGALLDEVYRGLTGSNLPKVTLAAELEDWLLECRGSTAPRTVERYESFSDEFKTFLGVTDKAPMLAEVTTDDVRRFLNAKRVRTAASTANLARKTLSAVFIRAVRNQHLRQNPVSPVKPFKAVKGEKVKRRAYTLAELGQLYTTAPNEFWRYMILGEFCTGIRMGDLICLQRGAVDLSDMMLRLEDDKTEKPMKIPLAKPFQAMLTNIIARMPKAKPLDYLWPVEAARYQQKGSGAFSSEFYKRILVPCELVPKRSTSHASTGKGHSGKRQLNEVSFHCLRHSFVSFLYATGSNQAVAKELVGHSSDAVHDLYTHNDEEALATAIKQLPMRWLKVA